MVNKQYQSTSNLQSDHQTARQTAQYDMTIQIIHAENPIAWNSKSTLCNAKLLATGSPREKGDTMRRQAAPDTVQRKAAKDTVQRQADLII